MDSGSLRYISEPAPELFLPAPEKHRFGSPRRLVLLVFSVLLVLSVLVYFRFLSVPASFPSDTVISIPTGQGLSTAASRLKAAGIIRSAFGFKAISVLFGGTRGLQAGDYYFEAPVSAATVAWRLSRSMYDLKNVKVTIPEGLTVKEIGNLISRQKNFTHFDKAEFASLAAPYEGYLFPDTYLFLPNVTAQNVMDVMIDTYKKKIAVLEPDVVAFGKPIQDIIRMASILEEEGRTDTVRATIAGILWKRLAERMPLQVDASIVYLTGKTSGDSLSADDFKIDSPYNTYLNKGLPPTPISNPGLAAIAAAIHPIATKYYFYLTDRQGGFHTAVTYEEHLMNKEKYLGN